MNQEQTLKALTRLGLTEIDAEIYLLLAKEGPQKARSVAEKLRLHKGQLYRSLNRLQKKGMVNIILGNPTVFSALSPDKILDFIIEMKKEQAMALQESREELLSRWRAITKKGSEHS